MTSTAVVIVNPHASRAGTQLADALELLSRSLAVEIVGTPDPGADTAGLEHRLRAAERVIVIGGDGTLHHILPLLIRFGKPIGVIPLGTANDFARSVRTPTDLHAACSVAAGNTVKHVDVGLINGQPFLNVASFGVAEAITRLQTRERKRALRVLSYAVSLFQAVRSCKPFRAEIEVSGRPLFKGVVLQASIANGRYHGGGLATGPNARIDDGLLHIYTVAARRWWQLWPVVPALLFGTHKWARCLHTFDAESCTVRTRAARRATVDGELVATKAVSFTFGLRKNAMTVLVPDEAADCTVRPGNNTVERLGGGDLRGPPAPATPPGIVRPGQPPGPGNRLRRSAAHMTSALEGNEGTVQAGMVRRRWCAWLPPSHPFGAMHCGWPRGGFLTTSMN